MRLVVRPGPRPFSLALAWRIAWGDLLEFVEFCLSLALMFVNALVELAQLSDQDTQEFGTPVAGY